ncbi:hypothetical protein HanXRQr2_Chr14g0655651 [Helianthus annuus]|uniref:Uncharacterized protein n=1 Tax=Helianthus annuus TaxID=4232 RepID=A0A251SK80_HELAN|nr:hypothetical protein HanXRQr2_Chr14g0655651 [Helianthus annuus]KAJ0465047.1 putative MACPF domain-containing protein CAD1/NSL1 [Helianthus annuus]KAJ0486640.1 putative MACPF domain-containing protein CAD1/NSL1 [Helianthus annuus]KAJ0657212.1 putative MACPF domain-containing protein CAD1/NSL1 [Helianthus annuus]KAJ0660777.1 putative MACPF domain-containing protein CAD1/NSL1 [Helianthus annuus]
MGNVPYPVELRRRRHTTPPPSRPVLSGSIWTLATKQIWWFDEMEENAAALHTVVNSVQALGKGFDVNFDTRLLYCKGVAGSKVVEIDEEHTRDVWIYDNLVVPNVSRV